MRRRIGSDWDGERVVKRGQQMACWEPWKVRRDWCVVNVGNAGKEDGTPAGALSAAHELQYTTHTRLRDCNDQNMHEYAPHGNIGHWRRMLRILDYD